jgi:hypothetical protein
VGVAVSVADTLAAAAAVELDVRSAHLPPFRWTPDDDASGGASSGGGGASWFLRWLRPEVRIVTAFGSKTIAPGGTPPARSSWPLVPVVVVGVLLAVLGLAGYGLAALIRGR